MITKDLSVSKGAGRSFFTQEGKTVENDPPEPIEWGQFKCEV